jgi:phosphatidylserine/phosphatidylglycerophosphate/cardiolipin synthase-like enzyme
MMPQAGLAKAIHCLVADLPGDLVSDLANALIELDTGNWTELRTRLMDTVAPPGVRDRMSAFVDAWQSSAPGVSAASVALALLSAASVEDHHRRHQRLELVWTGPDSEIIPLRRTDQALLQLIDGAKKTLHVVSFAVYKAQAIAQALVRAARRGVSISVYLETPDASEGRVTFDTVQALGADVARRARIYIWPLEKRLRSPEGKHGSLHAKIAVADGRDLLISSANLTEYAMTLNMEMGLRVRGGDQPAQVEAHLMRLVEQGVFQMV